jgi:dUTP pyrophosphatase
MNSLETNMKDLRTLKLSPQAILPTRAHPDDAGLDLYALEPVTLEPGQGGVAATGIAVALPAGHVGLVADRSSLAKRGLKTAGGVIDAGYRGELKVVLWNLSGQRQTLARGERVGQLLILPVAVPAVREAASLDETVRGANGFGSTGQ